MEHDKSCDHIKPLISPYFDGELSQEETEIVEEHLGNCPECYNELRNIENVSNLIKTYGSNINTGLNLQIETNLDNIDICDGVCEKLSPFLDRELSKDEMSQISEHLLACKHCRRDFENLKITSFAIKNYFKKASHESTIISHKVLQRLAKSEENKRILNSTAAAIIVAVLSLFSINTINPLINDQPWTIRQHYISLKAEDYLFDKAYSVPPEKIESVIYEYD